MMNKWKGAYKSNKLKKCAMDLSAQKGSFEQNLRIRESEWRCLKNDVCTTCHFSTWEKVWSFPFKMSKYWNRIKVEQKKQEFGIQFHANPLFSPSNFLLRNCSLSDVMTNIGTAFASWVLTFVSFQQILLFELHQGQITHKWGI